MKTNPLKAGALAGNSARPGPVTRKMVKTKREFTRAPEQALNENFPESVGRKAPVNASADEDSEGRSANERLVDQGIIEAERDRFNAAENSDL